MSMRCRAPAARRGPARLLLAALVAGACLPALALAATLPLTGILRTAGGGPVPDGKYVLIGSLYEAVDAPQPVWDETLKSVEVGLGSFHVVLGETKPLPDALIASDKPLWLGIQVGAEPELPRVQVQWTARSWYAKVAGAGAFPYAAAKEPGGKATGLDCSGCVVGPMLASGTVTASHVGFAYAGSDSKGGPATSAVYAETAGAAKQAEIASQATLADVAKKADKATTADDLACTGCIGLEHLAPNVAQGFLATSGGTVDGPVKLAKGLDLGGSELQGARIGALDVAKSACDAAQVGRIVADAQGGALWYCNGKLWQKVRLCASKCLEPGLVACGQPITDDCGDVGQCSGKGTLCGVDEVCKSNVCTTTLGEQANPALRCADVLAKDPKAADGLYWLDPNGGNKADAFQVWCRMGGDYPGTALVIRRPGSVAGQENHAGDLNLPCTPASPGYCKLSDAKINAIRQTSSHTDAFVVLSYKDADGTPFCRSYAAKSCNWVSNGAAAAGCNNAVVRDSGQYCARNQTTDSYRGIDGHTCGNLKYPGVTSPDNPFVIFEHSGGSHYCGGWDTTWNRIELLIN